MDELTPSEIRALLEQTMALGKLLQSISEAEPEGTPSAAAGTAFRHWAMSAGPVSTEPRYFEDILANYDVEGRNNKDLFDVFELLNPYIELPYDGDEDDDEMPEPKPRTFIPLQIS